MRRIHAFKDSFCQEHYLRLHMTLLLSATAGAAALVSKTLLWLGMADMRLRYPVAALLAYGVFLGLVRLWLWYVADVRTRRSGEIEWDFPELPEFSGPDFDGPDLSFDLDELFAPLVLALAVFGLCFTGAYLVWIAPELLAEIALQGLMAASLHEGILRMRDGRWLWCTFERTWLALAGTLVLAFAVGWALRVYCPGAQLLSQAAACAVRP